MARGGSRNRRGSEANLRPGTPDVQGEVSQARRSFDSFLADFTITDYERRELVFFLAAYRYRKTIETLL